MRIQYQEENVRVIFKFFVESFKPSKDEKIVDWETFYDQPSGKVIFKLYIEDAKS